MDLQRGPDAGNAVRGSLRPGHLPALDGVRGIAILIVMVLHFSMITPQSGGEWWYRAITGGGWAGVDLFFVLSGFLITGILLDARGQPNYFRNFYIRRGLRIFPLYYAFLLLIFVGKPLAQTLLHLPAAPVKGELWFWAYLSNVRFAEVGWDGMPGDTTHLWSLALEEQFYLIWPFVVFLADRRTLLRISAAIFAAGPLIRLGMFLLHPDGRSGYVLLPARADALALGAFLALIVRRENGLLLANRAIRPALLIGAGLLVLSAFGTILLAPTDGLFPPLQLHTQLIGFPAVAMMSAALVAYAVTKSSVSKPGSLLTRPALTTLGRYSYAIYIVHIPIRNLLHPYVSNAAALPKVFGSQLPFQLIVLIASIAASTALAAASWHLFEKHVLDLKRFFPYGKPASVVLTPIPERTGAA